ncbi:sigma-54-dependent transcriptional regulator [Rhizobium sp. G187]|uniref:sigma-54-dependent transcriptional regulator n=1 Tax=unclassified Rhizobium TaxID=2613769 RepID=UPI0006B92B94|nr:sigma-54 dependent transcriptional regulator [Rhizobium sp. AAP43]KPF46312.1 Fis family transcriptional regulator [Rhizobium sp. AAP43]
MNAQVLLIDEDVAERRSMKSAIEAHGHVVHVADTGQDGIEILIRHRDSIGVVVVDSATVADLADELLPLALEINAALPVIVEISEGADELALDAVRAGAFDFLVKPVSSDRLVGAIEAAMKVHQSAQQGKSPRRMRGGAVTFADIVAVSATMSRVVELGRRAAQSTIPVMLEGETGVGKETVARAIHSASERSSRPFVSVNCNGISPAQMDEALFGNDLGLGLKGAPSGKFFEADGGTLYLNEVAELPLSTQMRLLDIVQHGEIRRPGQDRASKVNVRLILATSRDLIEEVKSGRFREDLYYRLNVFPITIASLRRRKEDIPHLVRSFVERFSLEQRLAKTLQLEASAIALLTAFDWPGNTRQLENAVFRAVVLAEGSSLREADFPHISAQVGERRQMMRSAGVDAAQAAADASAFVRAQAALFDRVSVPSQSAAQTQAFAAASMANVIVSTDEAGNVRKLAEIEEELIRFALKFYRGQMSQVARKLGIGRSTLYRKLKDYGIDPDNPQKSAA